MVRKRGVGPRRRPDLEPNQCRGPTTLELDVLTDDLSGPRRPPPVDSRLTALHARWAAPRIGRRPGGPARPEAPDLDAPRSRPERGAQTFDYVMKGELHPFVLRNRVYV